MNKIIASALALMAFQAFAQSPSNSTSATVAAPSTATSSTSATEATAPETKSKWSGSVMILAEKDAATKITKDTAPDDAIRDDDNYDPDATNLNTQTHIGVGYKFDNGNSIKVTQRIYYERAVRADRQQYQDNGYFVPLRVAYNIPGKVLNGDGVLTLRVGIPTNRDYWETSYLGQLAVIPSLNWDINPRWSISYSGFAGAVLYNGQRSKELSSWEQWSVASGTRSMGYYNRKMQESGAFRSHIDFSNAIAVSYNITDDVSFSQSVGQSFGLKNLDFLTRYSQSWDLGTSIAWNVNKKVSLELGVSQGIADMPGSVDPNTDKPVYFDGYNVGLFRPEQTTYSLATTIAF